MKYATAKRIGEMGDRVIVHTRAFTEPVYLGDIKELTRDYLLLSPVTNLSCIGGQYIYNSDSRSTHIKIHLENKGEFIADLEEIVSMVRISHE